MDIYVRGLSSHSRFCVSCGKKYKEARAIEIAKTCIYTPHDILLGPLINLYAISLDCTKNCTLNYLKLLIALYFLYKILIKLKANKKIINFLIGL